ncbi:MULTISPECIES: ZIP family metal transporter [Priestia]|uniref:ZIP family metal transporter n=1 Tax=Priestia TaxID=2800373 RepID=UPI00203DA301|nr:MULTISPECIES: ZIP family metal transporter [Priestia]MCM3772701.1 ZIP family metal transporter [Priestia aryabhattai]MDY0941438.1 ZIP family metal transporter [Priestia megaterium]
MIDALMWGGVSGSAVLIGAIIAIFVPLKKQLTAYIMAFGTGVLLGAAAYELIQDSVKEAGIIAASSGFLTGAGLFTLLDMSLAKKGAHKRKRSNHLAPASSGLAIFIGTIMDAIPESLMIGASLIEQHRVSCLLVVSIFISNIPEGISGTSGLLKSQYNQKKIFSLWLSVLFISALCSWIGYLFLQNATPNMMGFIASFAGGGIIAMVASTMLPEALEEGGPVIGFIASLGLLTSIILDYMSF